jgi:hypothetical protein
MTQRIRNLQIALAATLPASEVLAIESFAGFSMNAYKAANQTVSASTTFVNDDTLWTELPTGPNRITIILPLSITAAGGLKLQLVADQGLTVAATTGVRLNAIYLLDATAPSVQAITALATPVNGGTTNAWTSVLITGSVFVTNRGVLQLQFAQQAASGASTIAAGATLDTVQISA